MLLSILARNVRLVGVAGILLLRNSHGVKIPCGSQILLFAKIMKGCMSKDSFVYITTSPSEHCSCRQLAQLVSSDPHLASFDYCQRVLHRRWHMQCKYGESPNNKIINVKNHIAHKA